MNPLEADHTTAKGMSSIEMDPALAKLLKDAGAFIAHTDARRTEAARDEPSSDEKRGGRRDRRSRSSRTSSSSLSSKSKALSSGGDLSLTNTSELMIGTPVATMTTTTSTSDASLTLITATSPGAKNETSASTGSSIGASAGAGTGTASVGPLSSGRVLTGGGSSSSSKAASGSGDARVTITADTRESKAERPPRDGTPITTGAPTAASGSVTVTISATSPTAGSRVRELTAAEEEERSQERADALSDANSDLSLSELAAREAARKQKRDLLYARQRDELSRERARIEYEREQSYQSAKTKFSAEEDPLLVVPDRQEPGCWQGLLYGLCGRTSLPRQGINIVARMLGPS